MDKLDNPKSFVPDSNVRVAAAKNEKEPEIY